MYFSEPVIGFELSVLDYWKENRERYPVLHAIATDFLNMMPTKVASERSVSLAGLTITDIRSSLNPHTANQTICFVMANTFEELKIKKNKQIINRLSFSYIY